MSEQSLSLTPEALQALISTAVTAAVEAAKKPYVSEQDLKKIEADQESRRQQAEQVKQMAANKKREQELCSHMRKDNTTRAVYVGNGNFLLCQKCQCIIRPETNPDLFNRLFQLANPAQFS